MLLRRTCFTLGSQFCQCTAYSEASITRFYHIIHKSVARCLIRIREEVIVFFLLFPYVPWVGHARIRTDTAATRALQAY